MVYAERNDPVMQQPGMKDVEIPKSREEQGKYLTPALYGAPEEARLFGSGR